MLVAQKTECQLSSLGTNVKFNTFALPVRNRCKYHEQKYFKIFKEIEEILLFNYLFSNPTKEHFAVSKISKIPKNRHFPQFLESRIIVAVNPSPMETVRQDFVFSIGKLLVFIGKNLQFTWVSFQMCI